MNAANIWQAATSWTRFSLWSFSDNRRTCVVTVPIEIPSWYAISLLLCPRAR